jgi:hypothetical protein
MIMKTYALGYTQGHYVTIPNPDYFGDTPEEVFDKMQEDELSRESIANLAAYEVNGIFWDKEKREDE